MTSKFKILVRRVVVYALQKAMGWAGRSLNETLPQGPILVIAPHPDDEMLGCAATLLHLKEKGCRIRIVIVTDGAAATESDVLSATARIKMRRTEAQKAARTIGIPETEIVFLPYPDRGADACISKIAQDILAQIWLCSPVLILSPLGYDGHPDHRAVAQAMKTLWDEGKIPCRLLEYPMWFWVKRALHAMARPGALGALRALRVQKYLEGKKQAIAAYDSQFHNVTGEACWTALPASFLQDCLGPYEFFFERIDK